MNHQISSRWRYLSIEYDDPIFIKLILLIISFLAYGILINSMGFYWDDLPYLYVNHSQGLGGYIEYMSFDRPFSAPIFMLVGLIFKENAFGYHLYILIIKWLCAIEIWRITSKIWPDQKTSSILFATLFLVYPGFKQTQVSLIYSLHFTVLALFLYSIYLMVIYMKSPGNKFWVFAGSLITAFGMFACEYFAMLELLRPLIIWKLIHEPRQGVKERILRTIKLWLPYLIIFFLFIIWRILIFKFPTYQPFFFQEIDSVNNSTSLLSIGQPFRDIFIVTVTAWFHAISNPILTGMDISTRLIWLTIFIATSMIFYLFLSKIQRQTQFHHPKRDHIWYREAILGGIISMFLVGIPLWATNLSLDLNFPSDRLTLPFSIGCALMVIGLFDFLIKKQNYKFMILSLMIGFAVGFFYLISISYLNDWQMINDFFWQMYWRAPSMEKGTTLITDDFPLNYYSDNSITAPLNWIYDPDNHTLDLDYMFYFLSVRLGRRLPALEPGLTIDQPYRSFSFKGSTSNLLILSYTPPSCLHFIYDQFDKLNPRIPQTIRQLGHLSNIKLILSERSSRMSDFFLPEPEHTWCYYFQNAELAVQNEKWEDAIRLFQESQSKYLQPIDTIEYIPFIYAYIQIGRWSDALELSMKIHDTHPLYDPELCAFWENALMQEDIRYVPEEINIFYFTNLNCQ